MFDISDDKFSDLLSSIEKNIGSIEADVLSQFCQIEEWVLSKSTGMISVGPLTEHKFGLDHSQGGLLKLLRRYSANYRLKLASFFEKASQSVVTFTLSAQISLQNGDKEPVVIIGKSNNVAVSENEIKGIFIYPIK